MKYLIYKNILKKSRRVSPHSMFYVNKFCFHKIGTHGRVFCPYIFPFHLYLFFRPEAKHANKGKRKITAHYANLNNLCGE